MSWILSFKFVMSLLKAVPVFQESPPESCLLFQRIFTGELGQASIKIYATYCSCSWLSTPLSMTCREAGKRP